MNRHRGIFVERLRPFVISGDVEGAAGLLRGLEGEELREARTWFDSSTPWWRETTDDHLDSLDAYAGVQWIRALCAVDLSGPRTAARSIVWSRLYGVLTGARGQAELLAELRARPVQWAADFVDAASHLPPPQDRGGEVLARVVRATTVHHGLPCPTGHTFLARWLEGSSLVMWPTTSELIARLTVDPLMPDVLLGMLGTGDCGRWPALGEVITSLVGSGHLDRDSLVEVVLEQLTAPQRPKSQQVLSEILAAVGVGADEVPGGLAYLLGVLATAHRSVQPVLLPMAVELATRDGDWRELVDLVVGRPDKRAKEVVLAALKGVGPAGVGREDLADLLDALVTGEDAAFDAKVAKVRTALGLASTVEERGTLLGLWDLPPTPQGTARPGHFGYFREPTWSAALSTREPGTEDVRRWLTELALVEMAEGSYDGAEILAATGQLLDRQELLASACVAAFEDLFLAGGLKQGWPTAVAVADLAAGAARPPSGLAALVRLLARYAPEVAGPRGLPSHLAALAAGTSRTKAAMEAAALAEALGIADDPSAATPAQAVPVLRGLWSPVAPDRTFPEDLRVGADPIQACAETTAALRELLSEDFNGSSQSFDDVAMWPEGFGGLKGRTGLTEPDRVLAATVAAAGAHGASAVQQSLRGIERTCGPVDVVAAVDAWADGGLDPSTFWRLAIEPVVSVGDLSRTWREQDVSYEDVRARIAALPRFAERLRSPVDPEHGALVVPWEMWPPLARFAFLRAAETLIRAEDGTVVLSTPTWRDGTLGVEDLICRLELAKRGSGVVGPLDLVQALHRLRDVDARLVDDVPRALRTDPRFTHPDGTLEWDATELVQRWLGLGGLPGLEPRVVEGRWHGPPTAPVPFTSLHAWPAELADDPWNPGPIPETLRLHPRWADRALDEAFDRPMVFDPRHLPTLVSGPRGVPFHDRLLSLVTPEHNQTRFYGSSTLVMLGHSGRLDPAAAAAAARGRHEAGTLSLNLLVKTFQREMDGALVGLWPTALAIAGGLSDVARRPPQLAELLRLLASYAHEVPASAAAVPPALRALARSKGSTKVHEAARELVAALDLVVAG